LKRREKVPGLLKPTSRQTLMIWSSVKASSRFAACMRKAARKWPGGIPTAWRKSRLKWKGLMKATRDMSSSDMAVSRL
jgi:hypothetical protein